jgi:hypothetical protein
LRILLDNCVPWRLAQALAGHDVASMIKLGWADLDDGPLLDIMAGKFDVLITMDKNIRFQQRLENRPVALLIRRARSNRLPDLLPLVPDILRALNGVKSGEAIEVRETA